MPERPPFVIFALPRSRTKWLSAFLSYRGWFCGHEEARHVRSIDDIRSWLSLDFTGTVETAAASFWRLLKRESPDARMIVVRRPVDEVVESLIRTGIGFDRGQLTTKLRRMDRKLDQIEQNGALSVKFADLMTESTCAKVFEHCLPFPHDSVWWARMAPINLQINLPAMLRYERAHAAQLRRVEAICVRHIKTMLRGSKMGRPDSNGVTLQEECFETAWPDASALMAEHCVEVGEAADSYLGKNVALLRMLGESGALRVMTARINGRMFGYLSSIASPTLESPTEIVVNQLSLFVSRDAGHLGLGLKLQRAAIEVYRARGINQVYMRAGVRGSGPRLAKLYEFVGARDHGRIYRLDLGEAA